MARKDAPAWRTHDHGWAVVSGAPGREVLVVSSGLPLVGRRAERAALAERILRARTGQPQFVLVRGTAGIGKTRLLREADLLARDARLATCLATCWEHDDLAYLPFTATLLPHVHRVLEGDADIALQLRHAMTITGGDPTRRRRGLFGEPEAGSPDDPLAGVGLQRAGEPPPATRALLHLIAAAAHREPMAIIIDDIQWADPLSLDLLMRLNGLVAARGATGEALPLIVIAAVRDDPGQPAHPFTLPDDEDHLLTLDLAPFDDIEAAELARASWFGTLADRSVESIVATAGGNPLFITTLATTIGASASAGRDLLDATDAELPERITASIAERLGHLSPGCRDLLVLLSMLADHGTVALLEALDIDDRALDDRIDEAVASGIIGRDGDRLVFTHPLYRHACYTSVATLMRKSVHLRIADALVAGSAELDGFGESIVAHHLLAAGLLASTDKVLTHTRVAADRALRLNAWAEATRCYEAVIDAVHRQRDPRSQPEPELIDLYLDAATARLAMSDLDVAGRHAAKALHLATLVGDDTRAARARLFTHRVEIMTGRYGETLDVEPLAAIVDASYHDDPQLQATALVEVSERLWLAGNLAAAQDMVHQALVISEEHDLPVTAARALVSESTTHWIHLDLHAARRSLEAAVTFSTRGMALPETDQPSAAPETHALALGRAAMTAWWSGDAGPAAAQATEAIAVSYRHDQPLERIMPLATRAAMAVARGDLAVADQAAYEALLLQRTSGDYWSSAFLYPVLASAFAWHGRWNDASLQLSTWTAEIEENGSRGELVLVDLFKLTVRAQRGTVAAAEREQLAGRFDRRAALAVRPTQLVVGLDAGAVADIELADALDLPAAAVEPALVLEVAIEAGVRIGATWTRSLHSALGTAYRLAGRLDEACAILERSVAELEELDLEPLLAHAHLELATAQALLGTPDRTRAARGHLANSRTLLARHGLLPLLERADHLEDDILRSR